MHNKIKVIFGLGSDEHEFEVAAMMTLNELQGKLDDPLSRFTCCKAVPVHGRWWTRCARNNI